ncbi:ribosome recycling factor [Candidatus Falkowbacteria bacterium]|jgi:ribosome recycling factor|nr:MAG: ribosome recycling factor [Candidatus Falkowbacteria bacterium]
MNIYLQEHSNAFKQAIDFFEKDISALRTGRANPGILEGIEVEAYGSKMALNAVGNISVADGRSMVIIPWDKTVLKDIEKALVAADLGVGVVNEGDKIRLSVPQLTEENRKELVKKLNAKMEEARIVIRQIRDEVKQLIEKAFSDKEIGEDDKFKFVKDLDEAVNSYNEDLKTKRDHKEKDIMTI